MQFVEQSRLQVLMEHQTHRDRVPPPTEQSRDGGLLLEGNWIRWEREGVSVRPSSRQLTERSLSSICRILVYSMGCWARKLISNLI